MRYGPMHPMAGWLDGRDRWLSWSRLLLLLLGAALCLRMLAMAHTPLVPEEAYYWLYAQHPAMAYYDHPPMVAWCITLGTAVFGDSEFGVRFVACALMLSSSVLMYHLGRAWAGRRAGLLAALMLQVLPLYFALGFIATMDAALVFFWLLGLAGVTIALKHQRTWGWYLAGIGIGGAALSKYTAVFLIVGILVALVAYPRWRRHLRSPHPYLAVLIAGMVFSPVIIWNATHGWASFRFQFVERFEEDAWSISEPAWFLAIQAITLTPPLLIVAVALAARATRRIRQKRNLRPLLSAGGVFACSFAMPLIGVMAFKSLTHTININWTLPAYLSLMPLLAGRLLAEMRRQKRRHGQSGVSWTQTLQVGAAICLLVSIGVLLYLLVQPRLGRIPAFGPWRELAAVVEDAENRLEAQTRQEPLVIGDGRYRIASVLAFYRSSLEAGRDAVQLTTSQWVIGGGRGLAFEYWMAEADAAGRDCIIVTRSDGTYRAAKNRFDSLERVDDARLAACKPYQVFIGHDLRPRRAVSHAGGLAAARHQRVNPPSGLSR